jgi:tRNA-specific 2-thiouridylase
VAGLAPTPGRYAAKTRYRQSDAPCALQPFSQSLTQSGGSAFTLQFDVPQWAVTPGQSAVLYDGDVCLGGGVIA